MLLSGPYRSRVWTRTSSASCPAKAARSLTRAAPRAPVERPWEHVRPAIFSAFLGRETNHSAMVVLEMIFSRPYNRSMDTVTPQPSIETRTAAASARFGECLVPNYRPPAPLFVRGEGSRLYDESGRAYLDLVCGIATCALGHCDARLVAALEQQARRLWHTSNGYLTEPATLLAERLAKASFADRAFFCNSGTEANEAAIKLVRRVHHDRGAQRSEIIV